MNATSEIKKLFATLNKSEQTQILKELSASTATSASIADFSIKHQKKFGSNVEFSVSQSGPDHCPTITAIAHTAFGDFFGKGSNQKIAKANAIELANKNFK